MEHTYQGMIVISVIFTIAIMIFAMRLYVRRRHYLKLKAVLDRTILDDNLALTRCQMVSKRLIAWDHTHQFLLVVEAGGTTTVVIDLKTAKKCLMIKKADNKKVKVIRLLFVTDGNRKVYDLILYKQHFDQENTCRKIDRQCRDWKELFNSHLIKDH